MIHYLVRRVFYFIPILFTINLLTFILFFTVNSPEDIARVHLGEKHVSQAAIDQWQAARGYDKPLFINDQQSGLERLTDTLLATVTIKQFTFNFGRSDGGRDIREDISERMVPSLVIAVPSFFLGILLNLTVALGLVYFRQTRIDMIGVVCCVALMSISAMFYIIGAQYLLAKLMRLFPISGFNDGLTGLKFLILPILVALIGGLGSGSRWYRTLFLEEYDKDYVKVARSKGLKESTILFKHVLKNSLIPILTGVVVLLPLLFLGSLLTESFFGIPGLGSYTIDAIRQQDFAIVRAMVFIGACLYLLGLILTDIAYAWVDPRIRLN